MKICSVCKIEKTQTGFYKSAIRRGGEASWCKECIREKRRIFRKTTYGKEQAAIYRRENKESKRALKLLRGAKRRAFDRDLPFELDIGWVEARLDKCELSGLPFGDSDRAFMPSLASIDRIDASKGYTKENSRIICYALNSAFNSWGSEVFEPIARAWLSRLANA